MPRYRVAWPTRVPLTAAAQTYLHAKPRRWVQSGASAVSRRSETSEGMGAEQEALAGEQATADFTDSLVRYAIFMNRVQPEPSA